MWVTPSFVFATLSDEAFVGITSSKNVTNPAAPVPKDFATAVPFWKKRIRFRGGLRGDLLCEQTKCRLGGKLAFARKHRAYGISKSDRSSKEVSISSFSPVSWSADENKRSDLSFSGATFLTIYRNESGN